MPIPQNVVATSQPLAAQADVQLLQEGGNAIDAALAAAITLTMVEPPHNGLGSDAIALVWDGAALHGLNGSGRSPQAWSPERFAGRSRMPIRGWESVTVPRAVDCWIQLWQRWGSRSLKQIFAPASHYTQVGFLVSPHTAQDWAQVSQIFARFPELIKTFFPNGRAPRAGDCFRCPDLGQSLIEIAQTEGESFYRGRLAEAIITCADQMGGALTL
jgi:gamma-glutamyltranspeptidase/glutathione hydrolase